MEQSILKSTKKVLSLADDYDVFDEVVIMHINTAFSTLTQLGVGPENGFAIVDDTAEWSAFYEGDDRLNSIKSYVYLKVRQLFDPPQTSYLVSAMEKAITELEWRMNTYREETAWVDPDPPLVIEEV